MSAQIKPKLFEPRWKQLLTGSGRTYVNMCALMLCCIHSLQYPNHVEGADSDGELMSGDKECPFGGVINSGCLEEGAGKRGLECGEARH